MAFERRLAAPPPMLRAITLVRGPQTDRTRVVDVVILNHEQRRHCYGAVVGTKGTELFVDFAAPSPLHDGDGLVLDTGDIVEVRAEAESLIEVHAAALAALARMAWALGDRHVPVQILSDRLRLRPDAGLEGLLRGLGGSIEHIVAPFEPEGGAYRSDDRGEHRHHDVGISGKGAP